MFFKVFQSIISNIVSPLFNICRSLLPDKDKLHELGVERAFRMEPGEDEAEARQALSRLMDDCEVFKCQVASLGRQAYDGWSRSNY